MIYEKRKWCDSLLWMREREKDCSFKRYVYICFKVKYKKDYYRSLSIQESTNEVLFYSLCLLLVRCLTSQKKLTSTTGFHTEEKQEKDLSSLHFQWKSKIGWSFKETWNGKYHCLSLLTEELCLCFFHSSVIYHHTVNIKRKPIERISERDGKQHSSFRRFIRRRRWCRKLKPRQQSKQQLEC